MTDPADLRASTTPTDAPVLVLGIGNELLGDDGVGVVAARRLGTPPIPGVDVLDGGTLGLMLMPYLAGRDAVLILDAVSTAHGRPGDVIVIPDGDVRRGHGVRATAHDIGLVDALAATELAGCAPRRVALVGVVPESVTERWGLSPLLDARVDALVDAARSVLAEWSVLAEEPVLAEQKVQVPGHA
ncbi:MULTISPECIES: HyaD/HybD family hydrogenase maturation endopeptidase [Parafrankia]|uniref:Hydrogenase maturation protease n=1 Tax=Parafrankia soli TaxID=2599596 RepID=A0A1S1PSY1_9ACTN|nr:MULTISPECIES: HyaD/HybD family hydrogenase maturation endopeptidase [Parafrankia]OHV23074.1 hydrogenase maturation protease [Parafrankia soli]TCJ31648.1 hydrogenase maturation protease [Parafrankia sp. BMG5.11]CAI7974359.1 hydrogenase maturation protease [Frankia sp. Hr75.2]SQD95390.1 Hydrogenase maturation protease [Parafrankia sp. Ea1.12]